MHISAYGYTDPNDYSPCLPARVVGEHRGRYQIVCDAGAGFATLRGGNLPSDVSPSYQMIAGAGRTVKFTPFNLESKKFLRVQVLRSE